tara:strand:- start:324 stop:2051 length:1728 start_codon:yes stop_codon:yes gene_type:complete
MFTNGIVQNCLYLANLFLELGHEVKLLSNSTNEQSNKEIYEGLPQFNYISWEDAGDYEWDVIVSCGIRVQRDIMDTVRSRSPKAKFVRYNCGNQFIYHAEKILFDIDGFDIEPCHDLNAKPDQIWTIPPHESTNLDFFSYMDQNQRNVTVVPFVWDPMVVEQFKKAHNYSDWSQTESRIVGIFEPNMNIVKNLIYPLVACSMFLDDGNKIDSIHSYCTRHLSENESLINLVKMGHPCLLSKIRALERWPLTYALNKEVDLVLSWQMANALNYLYLDAAWLGWPVVHNAHLCKDVGYYYPDNDMQEATRQMKKAFEEHTSLHKDEQRLKLFRYTCKNERLKRDYQRMLDNLMKDRFVKQMYDAATNSISNTTQTRPDDTVKNIFTQIFNSNSWGSQETRSGPGSCLDTTVSIREGLIQLISNFEIKSVVDCGCGDLNWMSKIVDKIPSYIGFDIVSELIADNNIKFPQLDLRVADMFNTDIMKCDLLIVRDVLTHYSRYDIKRAINNIKRNNPKYVLLTNNIDQLFNPDVTTGRWSGIGLQNHPYNFPEPLTKIDEYYTGKYVSLWKTEDIPDFEL